MSVAAEVISVGTELLEHGRRDTNSHEIADLLRGLGFVVRRRGVVSDDLEDLRAAVREASARSELVVLTGGLGPTADDRTRDAVAAAFGRDLEVSPALATALKNRFHRRGREMPASNLRQAMVPEGAEPLANPAGTAPGLWLEHAGGVVLALPGPPHEMRAVLDEPVRQRLRERLRPPPAARAVVRCAGLGESLVADRVKSLLREGGGVSWTILADAGMVELSVTVRGTTPEGCATQAEEMAAAAAELLGDAVFARQERTLPEVVAEALVSEGLTLAVAESCTGGLLGGALTAVPGSSCYFRGGVIAYDDAVKVSELEVPADLLRAEGAVSEAVARRMAEGVRRRLGADLGLSATGVAGPAGGTPAKPVGRVHLALASARGTQAVQRDLLGDRERVRRWTVALALDLVRRRLRALARGLAE